MLLFISLSRFFLMWYAHLKNLLIQVIEYMSVQGTLILGTKELPEACLRNVAIERVVVVV